MPDFFAMKPYAIFKVKITKILYGGTTGMIPWSKLIPVVFHGPISVIKESDSMRYEINATPRNVRPKQRKKRGGAPA